MTAKLSTTCSIARPLSNSCSPCLFHEW